MLNKGKSQLDSLSPSLSCLFSLKTVVVHVLYVRIPKWIGIFVKLRTPRISMSEHFVAFLSENRKYKILPILFAEQYNWVLLMETLLDTGAPYVRRIRKLLELQEYGQRMNSDKWNNCYDRSVFCEPMIGRLECIGNWLIYWSSFRCYFFKGVVFKLFLPSHIS